MDKASNIKPAKTKEKELQEVAKYEQILPQKQKTKKTERTIIGTSKDGIESLMYIGTQNEGGYLLESDAFVDASKDSVYFITVNFLVISWSLNLNI